MRCIAVCTGDKYPAIYVHVLWSMLRRHVPHDEFVLITDPDNVNYWKGQLPQKNARVLAGDPQLPGWWSKLALFKPGLLDDGELNLYLDLDVVIAADFTKRSAAWGFAETEADDGMLVALDDFSYSLIYPKTGLGHDMLNKLGGIGTCNSSVMLWRHTFYDVYQEWLPEVAERLHGDQNWITQRLLPDRLALFAPGLACSYKYDGAGAAPITVFHGNPKPLELTREPWVKENWR